MEYVSAALHIIGDWTNLGLLAVGLVLGSLFGVLPGVSVLTAVVLVLPLTYALSSEGSIILLIGIYVSGIFAGSTTAILFNIPGDPQNACTAIDGYPMTRKGKAAKAIGAAIVSSAIGGLFGCLVLILVSRQLATVSLAFGPAEYFALTFLGLSVVSGLGVSSYGKTVLSVLAGLLLATFGVSEVSGESRFTFGIEILNSGFNFVPVIIGALAMSEVFEKAGDTKGLTGKYSGKAFSIRDGLPDMAEAKAMLPAWARGGALGTFIGALPGAGATVAAFVAYGVERAVNVRRKFFGRGEIAGVAAPETANNAAGMGTLVPLLALGIPGGGVAAVMLSALQIHGLQPGPLMFISQPVMVKVIFITALIANALILCIGPWQARYIVRLLTLPSYLLYPAIAVFCIVGAYSVNNNIFDVWVMLASGLVGAYLRTHGYSVVALVLGMVLGPIAEGAFVQGMIMFSSPLGFVSRPLSASMIALGVVFLTLPLLLRAFGSLRSWSKGANLSASAD
ncbi:MAG: tripartite tricarboxylate transporter permease [Hyphomicrobiales bacterium]